MLGTDAWMLKADVDGMYGAHHMPELLFEHTVSLGLSATQMGHTAL
jgi:hypothetical protein